MTIEKDMVNHPDHYQSKNGLEAWDVIKEFTADLSGAEAWGTQQALKYLLRWKHKNGKEDLEKAVVYIQQLIKDIEKAEKEFDEEFSKCMNPPEEPDECDGCSHKDDDADYWQCAECKHMSEKSEIDNYDPEIQKDSCLKECWDCIHNEESFVTGCNNCNPLTHNYFKHK